MIFDPLFQRLNRAFLGDRDAAEKEVNKLDSVFKNDGHGKPMDIESKVNELQCVYDMMKLRQEKGLANSDVDKVRINTVKADLEQAIAKLILYGNG